MTEPLLGVILATSSSRGSHIVFRWPNNPRLFKRYSKVRYYTENRPRHSKQHLDDELDPVRQKAKWDRNDEDDDEEEDRAMSESLGQSDTSSSSDAEDSDASAVDDDDSRSNRDKSEAGMSHGRSKVSGNAAIRSKSKSRWPMTGLDESSVRSNGLKDANHDKSPDSDAGASHQHLSPEEKARREERAARAYKTYLGYDVDILSSILNPRQELAHQKFELVVDDLAFLGHPVCVGKDGTWGQSEPINGINKQNAAQPYHVDGAQDNETASNRNAATETPASYASRAPLTQFHLVLVLDRPDPTTALAGMDLSSWLQLFYDNIVFKMTAALFAEQVRAEYVGHETEKLLALRERCMDDGQAYSAYAAQCLGISSLARCLRDLHKSISTSSDAFLTINDRMEVHVQLPPILQDPANMVKVSDIETELDPNDPVFLSGGGFAGLGKEGANQDGAGGNYERLLNLSPHELTFEEWTRTTGPYLLPWKTLLLLNDHMDDVMHGSAADSPQRAQSPAGQTYGFEQLSRKFSALFRPSLHNVLNFSEVADLLGWDLYEDVYPMVRHLIYYRQARVIDIPRPGHVYGVSPLFDFSSLPMLSRAWTNAFFDLPPLAAFLSQLSSSMRPLSALFPGRHQRQLALDVLIWLLRHDVVVKLHVRLRLIATEDVKRKTAQRRIEQRERHRMKKEKRQRRVARAEAKRMKQSQAEEEKKRKAAAESLVAASAAQAGQNAEQDRRGRSRDRDLDPSQSTETSRQPPLADEGSQAPISRLSISRPTVLPDPDGVVEAVSTAAAISGTPDVAASKHSTHHHHHHHNHQSDQASDSGRQGAASSLGTSAPINAHNSSKKPFDEIKFERRPVLRSRSPSTVQPSQPGMSVSFSNVDRPAIFQRSRAGTIGSGSSSGGARVSRPGTPTTSELHPGSRLIPSHVRDQSVGRSSAASSSVDGSVPPRARRSTLSGVKTAARSRSPSRARMRVRGFGMGAEVEIDDDEEEDGASRTLDAAPAGLKEDSNVAAGDATLTQTSTRSAGFSAGANSANRRRISTASERPELPPPTESASSVVSHSCSTCSSEETSGSLSSSNISLSSSQGFSSADELPSSPVAQSARHHRPRRYTQPAIRMSPIDQLRPQLVAAQDTAYEDEDFTESLIIEPSRASRRENQYIATMVDHKDPLTVKLFFRLLPYLNGKHTIDEIEYRVKMRRKDIRRLLTVFRQSILTFMHP